MGEISEEKVEIILRMIGPTRPSRIHVDPRIKVYDLRKLVAEKICIQREDLRLIFRGKALHDQNNGEDVYVKLTNSDSILAAVKPKGPVKHLREDIDSDEDDDDLKFHLPQSTSWCKRKLYRVLHDRLKLPDIFLMAIFSLSLKTWILIVLWFTMAPVAHRLDLGPVYILATGFALILLNLGRRQAGEASAYSIFNEDFRELPGTLNADRIDRDVRAGQF